MGEPHLHAVDSNGVVTPPPPSGPDSARPKRSSQKARPAHPVPTDRLKFDTQVQALRTICSASRNGEVAVTADDMGNLMGILPVTAVLNNSFFASVNLIEKEGRGGYRPTPIALEFQRKWTFDKAEAPKLLAPAFIGAWFFEAIKRKIELGDGQATRADLIETLAGIAGTDNSYSTQYGFLIEWLEFVGLVRNDSGVIRLSGAIPEEVAAEADSSHAAPVVEVETPTVPTVKVTSASPVVALTVEVVLTADDLGKLTSEQITALFDGIGKVAAVKDALKQN